MIKKVLLIFLLLPAFLIVLAHNALPAHHHSDDHQENHHHTSANNNHHGHDHVHHHHLTHHHSKWEFLLNLLKNIPHPDTENQAQQIFVKQLNKQESTPVDVVPLAIISPDQYLQIYTSRYFVIIEDKVPKDLLLDYFLPLRAPPIAA